MKKNNQIQSILIFLVALGVSADYTIAQGAAQGNLVAGAYHTAVILNDGSVKTWGSNSHTQLGQGIAGSPNSQGDAAGEMGDDLSKVELGTGRTAVRIAAGSYHTAVILDDGSVKVWGKNQNGQLGQGNRTQLGSSASDMGDNLTAVDLGTGKTAVAIAAGTEHTAVILNDGSVKAWGFNSYGQLGLGHSEHMGNDAGEMGDNLPAVDLGTGRTAVAIAAGNSVTGVILDDGSVKIWGFDIAGVLGQERYGNIGNDPNEMGDNLPAVDLGTGKTAVDIAIGGNHVVVLLNDGTIKAWGNNGDGELGQGRDNNHIGDQTGDMGDNLPTTNLPDGLTAIGVAAGFNHTIAIFNNGTVGVVGKNHYGQLGQGNTDDVGANTSDKMLIVDVGTGRTVIAIAGGNEHSAVILDDCTVKAWGVNNVGQLGQGNTDMIGDTLGQMGDNLSGVDLGTGKCAATTRTAISGGPSITFGPDNSSTNIARTSNIVIQFNEAIRKIDDSDLTDSNVDALITLKDTDASGADIVFNATVNTSKTAIIINPTVHLSATQSVYVAIGATVEDLQNNAILAKNITFTTGTVLPGQLNHNIASGFKRTAVILNDGSIKDWGRNDFGQLGLGNTNTLGDGSGEMGNSLTKVDLGTGRTAVAIAAGHKHTVAILDNGQVKIWGENSFGQLGQGNINHLGNEASEMGDNLIAVDLGTGRTAVAITAGIDHYAVILDNGSVKTWGRGNFGKLGQEHNSTIGNGPNEMGDNLPIVDLGIGRTAIAIEAGYQHTTVILDNGSVKVWGRNDDGELGQGNTDDIGGNAYGEMGDALSAIDLGTGVQVLGISGGGHHTSVILDDGSVKAFGLNDYGQLGKENTRRLGNAANEMGSNLTAIDLGTGLDAATTSLSITIDLVAPTVTFTPVNGTANVSSSASVLIAFNEPVRNTDNSALSDDNIDALITLKDTDASGSDIAFDATINSTKTLITIVPNSYFSSLQNVYVAIGATVEDASDNAIAATSITFISTDTESPGITWSPVDGSTDVPVNTDVLLSFNEQVRHSDNTSLTNDNVDALITLKNNDASGSDIGFDATLSSTASALDFGGPSYGEQDYVVIPHSDILGFGTGDYAYSIWFNTRNLTGGGAQQIFTKRIEGGGNYEVQLSSSGAIYTWTGNGITGSGYTGIVDEDIWNNIIVTRSGTTVTIYLNGIQVGQQTAIDGNTTSTGDLYIGKDAYFGEWFNGYIDEFSIWNETLTADEITALYNSGNPVVTTSNSGNYTSSSAVVGYWDFNEGTGTILNDKSGNNNHGTISGAEWISDGPGSGGNTVIKIAPTSDFNSGQIVYTAIGATVEDLYDNPSTASNTTFTIADILKPTITFSPSDGSQGVEVSSNITITFNEAVRHLDNTALSDLNVDALITLKDTDANGSDISFDATINTDGTIITVDPVSDFSSVQTVYGAIGASVEDASDNAIDAGNITFTTADTQGPTFIWNPTNGATGVLADANVTLTFTELIRKVDDTDLTDANVDALLTLKNDDANGSDISFFDATVSSGGGVSSLYFDGVNDYVTVQREVQDDITLQAWVKTETSRSGSRFYQGLGIVYADFPSPAYDFGTSILNGKFSFGTGFSDETILSTTSIDNNEWNHVVATREKSTGTISVYVNGTLENSLTTDNKESLTDQANIIIGANAIDSRYFKGQIREVAVWTSAISSDGVAALYNSGSPLNALADAGDYTSSSSLQGYWKFNDGTGLTAADASTSNNDGTITGAVWNSDNIGAYTIITMNPTSDFSSSQVVYAAVGATLEDVSDNTLSASSTTFTVLNFDAPRILSGTLAADNSYVLIEVSEAVYNSTNGSGALDILDFKLVFNQNDGTASGVAMSGISKSDGSALTGGETVIRLGLQVTGKPSGVETVAFYPVNESSIYDAANPALAMGTAQTTGPLTLNDQVPPIMVFSPGHGVRGVGIGSMVTISFSEPVRKIDNSILTDENVDALITLKNTNISGADIPFDATVSSNKKAITIDPTNYFESLQYVYVGIGSSLEDSLNNAIPDSSVTFVVADVEAPIVVFNPAHGDTGVAFNENITLTFSEPIRHKNNEGPIADSALDTIITLRDTDSTGSVLSFAATINASKTIITVNPGEYFSNHQIIYVGIGETVEDTVGNLINPAYAIFTSQADWAPVVIFNPAHNDVNVPLESNITLTFSEPVRYLNNYAIDNISIDEYLTLKETDINGNNLAFDASISSEKAMITIDPEYHFNSQQKIYVAIAAGLEDSLNNALSAQSATFTALDTNSPSVIFDPSDKSVNVPRNKSITISFTEPVRSISNLPFDDNNVDDVVQLKEVNINGTDIPYGATINAEKTVITVDPLSDFNFQQTIYVGIINAIEDTSNNLVGTASSIFTTEDDPLKGPSIIRLSPPDNSVDVSRDPILIVTFDENIVGGTGSVIIYEYSNETTNEFEKIDMELGDLIQINRNRLLINPEKEFKSLTSYYILFGVETIIDAGGNLSTGILDKETWNFTIRDLTLPLVTILPADSRNDVPIDTNVVLTFSEPIYHLDGSTPSLSTIRSNFVFQTNDSDRSQFNISYDLSVSTDGLTYTLDPKVNFFYAQDYIITVKDLQDATGNLLPTTSSSFTTVYGYIQTYITTLANPTNSKEIPIEVSFGAPVTGFTLSDIVITGGTGKSFSGGNNNYFFELVPTQEGDISIKIPEKVCYNIANVNDVNVAAELMVTYDGSAPTIKQVVDGSTDGQTDKDYQSSKTTYVGSWSVDEDIANIAQFKTALGTYPGESNIVNWRYIGMTDTIQYDMISLLEGTTYYLSIAAEDKVGNTSDIVISDGITIDAMKPTIGKVNDGTADDVDYVESKSSITANWYGFRDQTGEIESYNIAIGTFNYTTDIMDWVNTGTIDSSYSKTITLPLYKEIYFLVQAVDEAGNVSSTANSDGFIIDPYLGPPSLKTVTPESGSIISMKNINEIKFEFSEPLKTYGVESRSYHTSLYDYTVDSLATELTVTINPPLVSLDTIEINVTTVTDSAGRSSSDDFLTFFLTSPLGDINSDMKINVQDMNQFVSGWKNKDFQYELGPTRGSFPHLIMDGNSVYDLDDAMMFGRFWSWSVENHGISTITRPISALKPSISMRSNGFDIQPPSGSKTGQVFLSYDHEFMNVMIENANATNLSEIILSSNQLDAGQAIYEAGSLSRFDLKSIRVKAEQSENNQSPIFVSYIFYGSGNEIVSEGEQEITLVQIPESFALNQNYPNPFNPLTKIQYQLPYQTDVNLSIYDILGNEVIVLVHQNQAPGTYNIIWDAVDRNGRQVSGGVYFYRIKTREFTKTKKLILLK